MTNPRTNKPELISDGKCMRMVWKPDDGDGDSSQHLVERSITTVRGHPTWKIFTSDLSFPIIRGSTTEPPYYVYLDDMACYTIWSARVYTDDELSVFWPFDFDYSGHIKMGRKNRGRPAYLDETKTAYAKAPVRGKKKWFEFTGEPDIAAYVPLRQKTKAKIKKHVAKEPAGESDTYFSHDEDPAKSGPDSAATNISATSVGSIKHVRIANTGNVDPLQLGIEAFSTLKRGLSEADFIKEGQAARTPPRRTFIQPFDISPSSESCPATPSPKRARCEISPEKQITPVAMSSGFGGDGAGDGVDGLHEEPLVVRNLRNQNVQLRSQLKVERKETADLRLANSTLIARTDYVENKLKHYRVLMARFVNKNTAHRAELYARADAIRKASDSLSALGDQVKTQADACAKELAPNLELLDAIGTVLDEPGKYMHDHGMDEDWRSIQRKADQINEANGSPPNSQQAKKWSFS